MQGEVVLDASVAAKVFISETGSAAARALAGSGVRLTAPDLILAELANVAVKRCRRGDIPRSLADAMAAAAPGLLTELVPTAGLMARAVSLAADHGFSAYDALYVALAEDRGCDLVTADGPLMALLVRSGLKVTARGP